MPNPRHLIRFEDRHNAAKTREAEIRAHTNQRHTLTPELYREHVLDSILLITHLIEQNRELDRRILSINNNLVQLESTLSEHPEIDLNNIHFNMPSEDKRTVFWLSLPEFTRQLFSGQITLNELTSPELLNSISCTITTLDYFLRNTQNLPKLKDLWARVYHIFYKKSELRSLLTSPNIAERINATTDFFRLIGVDNSNIIRFRRIFESLDDFKQKSFLKTLRTYFDSNKLNNPKTIVEEILQLYSEQLQRDTQSRSKAIAEEKERTERVAVDSDAVHAQVINLYDEGLDLKLQAIPMSKEQTGKLPIVSNHLLTKYTKEQRRKIYDFIDLAISKGKTSDFLMMLFTYYKEPEVLIKRLTGILS